MTFLYGNIISASAIEKYEEIKIQKLKLWIDGDEVFGLMAILDSEREQYQVQWAKSGIKLIQYQLKILLF